MTSKIRESVDALARQRSENRYTDLKTDNFGQMWAEAVEGGDWDKICRVGDLMAAALSGRPK